MITNGITEIYFGLNNGHLSGGADTLALLEDENHQIAGLVLEPATGYTGQGKVFVSGCFHIFADMFIPYLDDKALWENVVNWATPASCVGDVDGDGLVNVSDFCIFASAYNSHPGQRQWNPHCDLNSDGKVNATDFTILGSVYLVDCP